MNRDRLLSASRLLALPFVLAACASPELKITQPITLDVDTSIQSPSQNARIRHLVLHYTVADLERSLNILTDPARSVSAHYLAPDPTTAQTPPTKIYRLVDEQQRAWHAGFSHWGSASALNDSAIGIEIVNSGFPPEDAKLPVMQRRWYPFSEQQFQLVGNIAQQIVKRYDIAAFRVVGHMDIAPLRKTDPGPLFPWERLHKEFGVGAWFDDAIVEKYLTQAFELDIGKLQDKLGLYGYKLSRTGILDNATRNVLSAFQMHFPPSRYDGEPDAETAARLNALLEKYFPEDS